MKKVLLVLVAFTLSLMVNAQDDKMASKESMSQSKDHVMMKNGKMMIYKGGQMMNMDQDITLSDGSVVSTNGIVKTAEGKTLVLKNGEMIDMSGTMMKGEKMRSHMMMREGKMMMVKEGSKSELSRDMTLENGTIITPSGTVKTKDGKTMQLREGEKLDMHGMIIKKSNGKTNKTNTVK